MSDFGSCGEVFNFSMFNMFMWFYHSLLTRGPIRHLKMAKRVWKSVSLVILGALEAPSGSFSSDSCRAGHKLWNEYWNIKIGQVLTSEMRKMWINLKMLVSPKLDKISKFQVHIWNQQEILHKIDVVL